MSETLKPCPFCGTKAEFNWPHNPDSAFCPNADCCAFQIETTAERWNTRPTPQVEAGRPRRPMIKFSGEMVERAINDLSNEEKANHIAALESHIDKLEGKP